MSLKESAALKERDEMEAKMETVFGKKISVLSAELREILIDDMVTAFENRLTAFCCASTKEKGASPKIPQP
jgi:hypothetical protein